MCTAALPLNLTMPIPPSPRGVDIAAIVSSVILTADHPQTVLSLQKATSGVKQVKANRCYVIIIIMKKQVVNTHPNLPLPLCPVCGKELDNTTERVSGGWSCKCGEFIPRGTAIDPFTGSSGRLSGDLHRRIKG
ncbi:MAG: hypothetical protein OHK0032_01350 [Thermodesulfovibrionales bacterium]